MHRARAACARGFDSLPSLSDVARLALSAQIKQKNQKWIFHRKLKFSTSVISSLPKIQYILECGKKTHRRIRRNLTIVCDPWWLGCNQRAYYVLVCKLYPRSVTTPIDKASIPLIVRNIPVMVRCIITGLKRGEGFAQLCNFSNFLGKTRPHARQPKNKASKTPHANWRGRRRS
jgi:hypothetical protein